VQPESAAQPVRSAAVSNLHASDAFDVGHHSAIGGLRVRTVSLSMTHLGGSALIIQDAESSRQMHVASMRLLHTALVNVRRVPDTGHGGAPAMIIFRLARRSFFCEPLSAPDQRRSHTSCPSLRTPYSDWRLNHLPHDEIIRASLQPRRVVILRYARACAHSSACAIC